MKKIFHTYDKWEDYKNGLFSTKEKDDDDLVVELCGKLLSDQKLFKSAIERMTKSWPYSTEENLSDTGINRRAWLGQASCCYEFGARDSVTKLAWNKLDQKTQDEANQTATDFIKKWELEHA